MRLRVSQQNGKWQLCKDGSTIPIAEFIDRESAIQHGIGLLKTEGGTMKVFNEDTTVYGEWSY